TPPCRARPPRHDCGDPGLRLPGSLADAPAVGGDDAGAAMPRRRSVLARPPAMALARGYHGSNLRIGVDIGGTKIEALALDAAGHEVFRKRIPTPRGDYEAIVAADVSMVAEDGAGTAGEGIRGGMTLASGGGWY